MHAYRHSFHAGNHADVLKHTVLLCLLDYVQQKDKAVLIADTHAGSAVHHLDGAAALKNREFDTGIGALWGHAQLPAALQRYVELVRSFNTDGQLRRYPGSAGIIAATLRPQDRLCLFETHPSERDTLQQNFAGHKQVQLRSEDGFDGARAVFPPPSRRGLLLMDPAYEDKRDYRRAVSSLRAGLERFEGGTYALWYPILNIDDARKLPLRVKALNPDKCLHVWLRVRDRADDRVRMLGSGMLVLNPPWTLASELRPAMESLVRLLGQNQDAEFGLESSPS